MSSADNLCRVVKLGSPNLNLLIIAGAALLYVAMFFYGISADDLSQKFEGTILCNVRYSESFVFIHI